VQALLDGCKQWVNHNIAYDAQVLFTNWGIVPKCDLICTVVLAKLLDSDLEFSGGYYLDNLAKLWLKLDITHYEARLKDFLSGSKDYGEVPAEIMVPYAECDIRTNRSLYKHIDDNLSKDCDRIRTIERELTPILCQMERNGLRMMRRNLEITEFLGVCQMLEMHSKIIRFAGCEVNLGSNNDMRMLFEQKLGLPIVAWTEKGNASFDKDAFAKYLLLPQVSADDADIISTVAKLKKIETFNSLFLQPFREFGQDDGNGGLLLHPRINQMVSTGRMSCREPNSMQFDKKAKELIIPGEGDGILVVDYSQLEFRVLAHYIVAVDVINKYAIDPYTDFHQTLAELTGMSRDSAKTLNFAIGFGGGRKLCIDSLSLNPDVIAKLAQAFPDKTRLELSEIAKEKAEETYNAYHTALPSLKPSARKVQNIAESRGHIHTGYGKRLHFKPKHAYKALPLLIQSHSACIQKDRTVALNKMLPSSVKQHASVHDSSILMGPRHILEDAEFRHSVQAIMESPIVQHKVPIKVNMGYSIKSWADADKKENKVRL